MIELALMESNTFKLHPVTLDTWLHILKKAALCIYAIKRELKQETNETKT